MELENERECVCVYERERVLLSKKDKDGASEEIVNFFLNNLIYLLAFVHLNTLQSIHLCTAVGLLGLLG